jgi:hypothetical protein
MSRDRRPAIIEHVGRWRAAGNGPAHPQAAEAAFVTTTASFQWDLRTVSPADKRQVPAPIPPKVRHSNPSGRAQSP